MAAFAVTRILMTTALEVDATRRHRAGQRVQRPARPQVPSIEQLLVEGGDGRIALDAEGGANKYGCQPVPDAGLIALGSSTASVISGPAFAAAERLRYRLVQAAAVEPQAVTYARELQRIRGELLQLCGVADLSGLEVVFGASGTDLHLIAGQLLGGSKSLPGLAVMVDAVETGSCVPAALAGRHFSDRAALGETVSAGAAIASGPAMEVVSVALRDDDGTPRSADSIDAEVTALVASAAAAGRRVLLSLVDVSKTGMIAPSPACALELRRRWPETVEVLIDACQFRIAPATLRAYLQHGFMVALTGSKFVTGPTFSGALLFPAPLARRYRGRLLPRALSAYSLRADWPQHWAAAGALANDANFGLLLRWQAALEELRAFRAVPEAAVSAAARAAAGAAARARTPDGGAELGSVANHLSLRHVSSRRSRCAARLEPRGDAADLSPAAGRPQRAARSDARLLGRHTGRGALSTGTAGGLRPARWRAGQRLAYLRQRAPDCRGHGGWRREGGAGAQQGDGGFGQGRVAGITKDCKFFCRHSGEGRTPVIHDRKGAGFRVSADSVKCHFERSEKSFGTCSANRCNKISPFGRNDKNKLIR